MTDYERLPHGMDQGEIDDAFRLFLAEHKTMTPTDAVKAITQVIMRLDYNSVRPDVAQQVTPVLINLWDDTDAKLCEYIAAAIVTMQRPAGRAFLEKKATCGSAASEAIARSALTEFTTDGAGDSCTESASSGEVQ